jgi:hypothetical protein
LPRNRLARRTIGPVAPVGAAVLQLDEARRISKPAKPRVEAHPARDVEYLDTFEVVLDLLTGLGPNFWCDEREEAVPVGVVRVRLDLEVLLRELQVGGEDLVGVRRAGAP